jgi:hypothetical protein
MGRWTSPKATAESTTYDDAGHPIHREWMSCVHCQYTWMIEPHSGKERGFCMHCMGPTCGPKCEKCIPLQRRLEIIAQWGQHGLTRALHA